MVSDYLYAAQVKKSSKSACFPTNFGVCRGIENFLKNNLKIPLTNPERGV